MSEHSNRRRFLKQSAAGAVAFRQGALHASRGSNEKLVVGLIGCGGRGVHDAGLFRSHSV